MEECCHARVLHAIYTGIIHWFSCTDAAVRDAAIGASLASGWQPLKKSSFIHPVRIIRIFFIILREIP